MSASEASRNFSTVLDSAEQRRDDRRYRSGRRVALISSASQANGAALREVFRRWHNNPALDDDFAERVAAARTAVSVELDTDPWRD
jgi:hypothetical protein